MPTASGASPGSLTPEVPGKSRAEVSSWPCSGAAVAAPCARAPSLAAAQGMEKRCLHRRRPGPRGKLTCPWDKLTCPRDKLITRALGGEGWQESPWRQRVRAGERAGGLTSAASSRFLARTSGSSRKSSQGLLSGSHKYVQGLLEG